MFTSIRTTELVIFSALSIALLQSSSLSISALENDLVAGVNRIGKDGQSFWERLFKGWNDVDGVESADDITSINAEDDQLNGDWLIEQQIPGEESMKVGALLVQRRRLAAVTKEDTFNNYQTSRQQHQERNERALSNQNNLKTHSESFLAKVIGDNEDYIMQQMSMSMNTQIPSAMNTQIPSDSSNINESSAPTPTTPVSDSPSSGFGQESSESTDDDDVEKNSDSKPAADDKACMASNGVFGSLEGEPSTVTFLYGIETVSNLSAMNVSDELLPPLEAAFSNLLLDLLFPLKCLSDSDEASSVAIQRKGGRSLFNDKDNANFRTADVTMRQHSRRGQQQAIVGISARPSDEISNDLKCTAPDSGNRSCFVVQGEITIFLEQRRLTNHRHLQQRNSTNEPGNATASDYELKVRNKLKEGMDSGKFDEGGSMNTDGQIKRVYYIEPDTDGSSIRGSDGTPTTLQTDNGVDAVLVGSVVAAAGALLVIFGIFAYRRRRGTAEIDGDSTTLNPDRTSF